MRFGLLGPLEVRGDDGAVLDVGGRQPRLVLGLLLLADGQAVPPDTLVDAVWGAVPPASATGTLQSYVSRLRRRLEPAGGRLTFDDAGYRLVVDPDDVDVRRFEARADEGRRRLAAGDPVGARAALVEAEGLWRGPALADLLDVDRVVATASRLEERRLATIEDRLDADLALGAHAAVAAELVELVAAHPLREALRARLALALYRSDRQADALRALADAGRTLREELGIEPGRQLRELEAAILAHDPALDLSPASGSAGPSGTGTDEVSAPATAVVGRDAELAALVAALDEAATDARFVVLEGEPGIGKTRLAEELRRVAAARGSLTAWGRSDEGGAAPALWPWLPLLRQAIERVGPAAVPPAVAELVEGEAPLLARQGAAVQFERFDAVADLLERAGSGAGPTAPAAPAVVLLDDLQWADATSLELLGFLAGRLGAGVLVLGTLRQLEVGRNDAVTDALAAIARRPGSRRLALRGLSPAATAELLREAGARVVPDAVAAAIHDRAEGNPFYAIELSRLADEEGGLDPLAAGEVPASVGDVVRRRLGRLPQPTVDLLGVAAVTGRDVDLQLLARSAELDVGECLDLIEPAVVHRLLVDVPQRPGTLRFSHALVREVLLEGLTSLRRARLHLRIADAIEASGAGLDDAEILAEHLWRAAPVGVGHRAAEALEQAAEVAVRRVSYAAAEGLLLRAVQLRRATSNTEADQRAELATVSRLLEVTQATRYFQGADRETLARAQQLAERLGEPDLMRVFFWYEFAALGSAARVAEASPMAEAYLKATADDPRPEVRSGGHEVYGTALWGQGRVAEAHQHFAEAVQLLEGAGPPVDDFAGEQQAVSFTFELLTGAMVGVRSEADTFAGYDYLIASVPAVAVPSICGFALTTAAFLGRWDVMDRLQAKALEADPASDFAFWGGQLLMFRGMLAVRGGDVDGGVELFEAGQARYTGIGGHSGLATFQATFAASLAEAGRIDLAERYVVAAWDELHDRGERWNEITIHTGAAIVAHAAGDDERAAEQLARAATVAERQGATALAARARALAEGFGLS